MGILIEIVSFAWPFADQRPSLILSKLTVVSPAEST